MKVYGTTPSINAMSVIDCVIARRPKMVKTQNQIGKRQRAQLGFRFLAEEPIHRAVLDWRILSLLRTRRGELFFIITLVLAHLLLEASFELGLRCAVQHLWRIAVVAQLVSDLESGNAACLFFLLIQNR